MIQELTQHRPVAVLTAFGGVRKTGETIHLHAGHQLPFPFVQHEPTLVVNRIPAKETTP